MSMKRTKKVATLLTFHFLLLTTCFSPALKAEEWGIAFSGRILETTESGVKVPALYGGASNYTANVYVRLYDESEEGATSKNQALWGRCIPVNVRDGLFSCELKDSAGVKLKATYEHIQDVFSHLTGDKVTVGVTPFDDTKGEIEPRQSLVSAPYAINAGDALGTVGDVSVDGKLTVGAASVPDAVFKGPVKHDGGVTFHEKTTLGSLSLSDKAPFKASALTVGQNVSVAKVQARSLTAENLTATVENVQSATFSNLTLSGSVEAKELKSSGDRMTIDGDVTADRLTCSQLVLGGKFEFFKWGAIQELEASSESSSKTFYYGNASNGEWTVPTEDSFGGDTFVSLSFMIPQGGTATVSVDGSQIAKLSYTGSKDVKETKIWLPVQAFLARGQKISWSGSAEQLQFCYRLFTY